MPSWWDESLVVGKSGGPARLGGLGRGTPLSVLPSPLLPHCGSQISAGLVAASGAGTLELHTLTQRGEKER